MKTRALELITSLRKLFMAGVTWSRGATPAYSQLSVTLEKLMEGLRTDLAFQNRKLGNSQNDDDSIGPEFFDIYS